MLETGSILVREQYCRFGPELDQSDHPEPGHRVFPDRNARRIRVWTAATWRTHRWSLHRWRRSRR